MPASLLTAAIALPRMVPAMTLPNAIATITKTPAAAVGFDDRGEIAAGKRADLVRIHVAEIDAPARDSLRACASVLPIPVVRAVWRTGIRVA